MLCYDTLYVEQFIEMLAAERAASDNTLLAYQNDALELVAYMNFRNISIAYASRSDVIEYFSYLQVKNLSTRTLARKLSVARQIFDFLVSEKRCDHNPIISIKNPKISSSLPKALSQDNVFLLIEAASKDTSNEGIRTSAMLEMLYATGMRISELVTLKMQVIERDLKSREVARHIIIKGKGGKERIVLLNLEAVDILDKYLEIRSVFIKNKQKTDWLFPSIDKKGNISHITRQRFGQILKSLAIQSGVPLHLVSPHKIRHSFATHMLENGANLRILQELMGHSDISSTQIYTKITSNRAAEIVFTKHPLAK